MNDLIKLSQEERSRLLKFACAAVWADLDLTRPEKTYILSLALRLQLPPEEAVNVQGYLEKPPRPEEVDPALIPHAHRRLFLEAVRDAVTADGVVEVPELESLRLLQELLD